MTASLVGSARVRRHPHHRARSAPWCGVSRGPAFIGSGPHQARRLSATLQSLASLRERGVNLHDPLELSQDLRLALSEISDHARVAEDPCQIALSQHEIEMVRPIRLLCDLEFPLQVRRLALHQ